MNRLLLGLLSLKIDNWLALDRNLTLDETLAICDNWVEVVLPIGVGPQTLGEVGVNCNLLVLGYWLNLHVD